MGYDFHTVRRTKALSIKLSDIEMAMVLSAQHRRGFEHHVHYLRDLLWEDGAVMAEPKFVLAAIKERWPQQTMEFIGAQKMAAIPRNWNGEYERLCKMVRAAMVFAPQEVPEWALQFNVPLNTNSAPVDVGEPPSEPAPASEAKPKKGAKAALANGRGDRRVKRRSAGMK
jgi:hypothetical protein